MKLKISIFIIAFTSVVFGYAQQDEQISLIYFDHLAINPGYAGHNNAVNANAIVRNQWLGFDENGGAASSTQILSVSMPLKLFGMKHGIGINMKNDKIAVSNNIALNLDYAYNTEVGTGNLGLGLDIGLSNRSMKFSNLHPVTPDVLPTGDQTDMVFDFGIGAFYKTDNLYMGISGQHLNFGSAQYENFNEKISPHFYITGGYTYQLANPLFEIEPTVHLKSGGAKAQVTYGGRLIYNKKYWGGVSYNYEANANLLFGMELPSGFYFALAYEIPFSKVGAAGSTEFMLGYSFNLSVEKTTPSYKSVRFL